MGHVWIVVEIFNAQKTKGRKVKGLVDTGATLTVLPKSLAEELEIEEVSEDRIQTGAGMLKIKRGRAIVRIEDKEDLHSVWISDIIDKVLIGSITLETLGLKVNPITGKIEEQPLMLYLTEKEMNPLLKGRQDF